MKKPGTTNELGVGDLMTQEAMLVWLDEAAGGTTVAYYRGKHATWSPNAAALAWKFYENGMVALKQKRLTDDGLFEYRMERTHAQSAGTHRPTT
jgi:hypothetical protein